MGAEELEVAMAWLGLRGGSLGYERITTVLLNMSISTVMFEFFQINNEIEGLGLLLTRLLP